MRFYPRINHFNPCRSFPFLPSPNWLWQTVAVDYGSSVFLPQISAFTGFRLDHSHCFSLIAGVHIGAYLILPEPAHGSSWKQVINISSTVQKKKILGYWEAKLSRTHTEKLTLYYYFSKCKSQDSTFDLNCSTEPPNLETLCPWAVWSCSLAATKQILL